MDKPFLQLQTLNNLRKTQMYPLRPTHKYTETGNLIENICSSCLPIVFEGLRTARCATLTDLRKHVTYQSPPHGGME